MKHMAGWVKEIAVSKKTGDSRTEKYCDFGGLS